MPVRLLMDLFSPPKAQERNTAIGGQIAAQVGVAAFRTTADPVLSGLCAAAAGLVCVYFGAQKDLERLALEREFLERRFVELQAAQSDVPRL